VNLVKTIAKRLESKNIAFEHTANHIEVPPSGESGFTIRYDHAQGEHTISFEGWHEHFVEDGEAEDCFYFGLLGDSRLKVEYRGDVPIRWTLQALEEDTWESDTETGLMFFPFWRKRRIEYLRNTTKTEGSG